MKARLTPESDCRALAVGGDGLVMRVHGARELPTLVYLPGLHGDWTLASSFRAAVAGQVRFVEFTYPRTLTWQVEDYAAAIEEALTAQGIRSGWLLAESFGSLVGWALVGRGRFQALGLVLAGGFVKHPWPWGARLMGSLGRATPMPLHHAIMMGYALYARFRHRQAPETRASIHEFVARRTLPDRQAMWARLELVAASDPRPIARRTRLPVFYLAGLLDPLVPWPWVRWWLRRNCPGYRGGKTCWRADHNALGTQPKLAAQVLLRWIQAASPAPPVRAAEANR